MLDHELLKNPRSYGGRQHKIDGLSTPIPQKTIEIAVKAPVLNITV